MISLRKLKKQHKKNVLKALEKKNTITVVTNENEIKLLKESDRNIFLKDTIDINFNDEMFERIILVLVDYWKYLKETYISKYPELEEVNCFFVNTREELDTFYAIHHMKDIGYVNDRYETAINQDTRRITYNDVLKTMLTGAFKESLVNPASMILHGLNVKDDRPIIDIIVRLNDLRLICMSTSINDSEEDLIKKLKVTLKHELGHILWLFETIRKCDNDPIKAGKIWHEGLLKDQKKVQDWLIANENTNADDEEFQKFYHTECALEKGADEMVGLTWEDFKLYMK